MKKIVKEMEAKLTKMIDEFQAYDYKKNALNQLKEIEGKTHMIYPAVAFIVNDYPDFNHIKIKLTKPDMYVLSFCFDPKFVKGNKKAIRKLAKMIAGWFADGALEEGKDER